MQQQRLEDKLIKTWDGIKIYLIEDINTDKAGKELMKRYVTQNDKDIYFNEFGKPFLKSKKPYFNLTHTIGYAAIAISENVEIGLDIELRNRKIDFRTLIMSRFNIGTYAHMKNQQAFIEQWTIRESAIKCYGDLTMGSSYKIQHLQDKNIIKCEGKEDVQYYSFNYHDLCICICKKCNNETSN